LKVGAKKFVLKVGKTSPSYHGLLKYHWSNNLSDLNCYCFGFV
jgi:hypothetical protein